MGTAPSQYTLPATSYKLGGVRINSGATAEVVSQKELAVLNGSPFTTPTSNIPVYTLQRNSSGGMIATIYPEQSAAISADFIRQPNLPRWGYTIVGERAMWNPDRATHFELHASEAPELVYKILLLAGITINRQDVSGAADAAQQKKIQQEKQ